MDLDALTAELFTAAEQGDWDRFASFFADDAVVRQNVVAQPMTVDEFLSATADLTGAGRSLRYENARRIVAESAVTEMHDAVFTLPDGVEVRLDACVVLQFDETGKIALAEEYLDSRAAKALNA